MTYQLSTNNLGRRRLKLQGDLYSPGSYQFLLSQGISPGQSVLEIGCGSGYMTPWLANQVGPKGRVLAIDNSKSQILATRHATKKLKQVECRQLSVYDLDRLTEKFDIIYLRLVLIHLTDPHLALAKAYQCLKNNGKVIIEEFLNSYNFCYPENKFFTKRRHVVEQFYTRNGLNPNFGITLKSQLSKLKLTNIQESMFQPLFQNTNQRKLLSLFLIECKDKFISHEILTLTEWKKLISGLEKLQKDKHCFITLSSMYQISAQK